MDAHLAMRVKNPGQERYLEKKCTELWGGVVLGERAVPNESRSRPADPTLWTHPVTGDALSSDFWRVNRKFVAESEEEQRRWGERYDWSRAGARAELLKAKRRAQVERDARAAFLERLEKITHPAAGLAPLVKRRLNGEATGKILLVPEGGDPASVEPCREEDELLGLLTSKSAAARGGWKWLGPGRVEMQFHAMIE